jgi:hypothetical protein
MSRAKDLALMTGLDKVYGCGALNWDIFFEVPSLDALKNIPSVDFEVKPGGEVAVSREKFLEILSHLEKQGEKSFFLRRGLSGKHHLCLIPSGI